MYDTVLTNAGKEDADEELTWMDSVLSSDFDELSFRDHLRNVFLVPFFKYTPQAQFQKRNVEMFTQSYTTSSSSVPAELRSRLQQFNYHPNLVFHFKEIQPSPVTYVPIFESNIDLHNLPVKQQIKKLSTSVQAVLVFTSGNIAVLLRGADGVVQEIGPVKNNAESVNAIKRILGTNKVKLMA
jgi:hypothetical protein